MLAATFQGPGKVSCETVSEPKIEDSGDALVRVDVSAVCGSDLHVYRGHETGLDQGTVMGHEFAGEVVAVGGDVSSIQVGDRVVSPFTTSCGACFYCDRGLTARCDRGQLFGWVERGRGLHGAQAGQVRVPMADSTLVTVPDGANLEEALLAGDVLSTGLFCAEMAGIAPGSVVVVLGCGPVGLMAGLAAGQLGAAVVFAVDSIAERLSLAASWGAEPIDLNSEDPVAVVGEATRGRGADAVLEAVGSPDASRLAIDLVRPGGVISAAGVHTEERFAFSPVEAYDKNLTYRAGRCSARSYIDRVLPWVVEDRFELGRLISHRLPLSEAARAYEIFDRKLDGCTKIVLSG